MLVRERSIKRLPTKSICPVCRESYLGVADYCSNRCRCSENPDYVIPKRNEHKNFVRPKRKRYENPVNLGCEEPECFVEPKHKVCPTCGASFNNGNAAIYCSLRCRPSSRPPVRVHLKKRRCPSCGIKFQPNSAAQVLCDCKCRTRQERAEMVAWASIREMVIERDNFTCTRCGTFLELACEVHHVVPVCRGGPTVRENLTTLCSTCHDGVHAELSVEIINGD